MKLIFFTLIFFTLAHGQDVPTELDALRALSKENKQIILTQLKSLSDKKKKELFKGMFDEVEKDWFTLSPDKNKHSRDIRFLEEKNGKLYFTTSVSIIKLARKGRIGETQIISQETNIYSIDKDLVIAFDKAIPPAKFEPLRKPDLSTLPPIEDDHHH